MSRVSRRECLGLGVAFAASGSKLTAAPDALRVSLVPDSILINGRVLTMDDAVPAAEAFAVSNGRFVAIGSTDQIRGLATRNTKVIDAGMMTVVPGFTDAHCHPGGLEELYDVNLDLRKISEIQGALRQRAMETPPGFWVNGFKFDDTKLVDDRPLSRKDLDEAVPDHPVCAVHRGGHSAWYNSKAFELAGITRSTPDPPGGRFFKDEDGNLQGQVADRARDVFLHVGKRDQFTVEQQRQRSRAAMARASKLLTAAGLTTVHDAAADADKIRAYQTALDAGELLHRAYVFPIGFAGNNGAYQKLRDAGVFTGLGSDRLRIGAVKYWADGSASERTMRMSTPYADRPGDYGILNMDQKEIHEAVEEAHRNNWQVAIHANGDVTIDMVLNAYERVLSQWPHPDRRHRIEHCTLVNPKLIERVKKTQSIPTPFWTYVYYNGEKWKSYGEEKLHWMFAHRSFLDAGIRVPGASDYTPGPFEPMLALQSMVTRKDYRGRVWGANQKVTVQQALRIGTINGAYASYEEKEKGSISVGKYADFVLLEKDPNEVDPDSLKDIRINRTVVGGQTVYSRTD